MLDCDDSAWMTADLAESVAVEYDTPTHVLNLAVLRNNCTRIGDAFARADLNMTVLYSVKTNYMPIVVNEVRNLGCGADVVSGPELSLALKLGFKADQVVFNGPHKTDEELERAIRSNVTINIDNIDEAHRIKALASTIGTAVKVGLRVNPGISVYHSADPTFNLQASLSAKQSKFGFSIDDGAVDRAIEAMGFDEGSIVLSGLHCHLGSQITDDDAYISAVDKVLCFAEKLKTQHPISSINIGGGFGVGGIRRERRGPLRQIMTLCQNDILTDQKDGMDINAVASGVAKSARRYNLQNIHFFCEPGRAIVSDSMCMVSKVVSVKNTGQIDWLMLDAGLNLFPTIAMAESHKIVPLTSTSDSTETKPFRIGGPLCYEGDVLSASKMMPSHTAVGDLVSIEDSGAYTVSRSTNFIRPRASVVVISDEQMELCWRRETFDDIFSFHVPTSHDEESAILHV